MTDLFSVGGLAARTGVSTAVLRTWENRYGFPVGERTSSGHRRFSDKDAELVQRVLAARSSGVPLRLAIDAVRKQDLRLGSASVFGHLATRFPELRPQVLDRRVLVAVSHAIEEECLSRGESTVVLGAFQSGARFGESRPRWEELARTAGWAAIVADFEDGAMASGPAGLVRVHLAADAPMRREWSVICLGPSFSALLAAWELPPGRQDGYEAVITSRRDAVLAAARVFCSVAEAAGASVPGTVSALVDAPLTEAPAPSDDLGFLLRALAKLSRH